MAAWRLRSHPPLGSDDLLVCFRAEEELRRIQGRVAFACCIWSKCARLHASLSIGGAPWVALADRFKTS